MARDPLETDDGRIWIGQETTMQVAKFQRDLLIQARRELTAACRVSSDPAVRGAYARFKEIDRIVHYLSGTTPSE